ncbi:phage tail assembly chaperone family protein, TAC [Pseudomonas solani]|uniref:phage tail assembly chaperone family protein, TAC n=1 Tax=Pseudomonas solani TaxID=2731552 RepID=UPI0035BE3EF1
MELSIESLAKSGSFTGRPVRKDIEWEQGEELLRGVVFVRPLGYQTAVNDVLAASGRQDGVAGRIAASIVSEAGDPIFTVADIVGTANPDRGPLDGNLCMALLRAIYEVNNPEKATPSPAPRKSGTSSSSRGSGAKASQKPRKP